jgi:hypothetical protein
MSLIEVIEATNDQRDTVVWFCRHHPYNTNFASNFGTSSFCKTYL